LAGWASSALRSPRRPSSPPPSHLDALRSPGLRW
jgi:hypothetical protein